MLAFFSAILGLIVIASGCAGGGKGKAKPSAQPSQVSATTGSNASETGSDSSIPVLADEEYQSSIATHLVDAGFENS